MSNTDVLERFIAERVKVEIIDENRMTQEDYESLSRAKWQVLEGGCFFNTIIGLEPDTCHEHKYAVWLEDITETHRVFWDLRYIFEEGCGEPLLI